jgi:hypothetical protein
MLKLETLDRRHDGHQYFTHRVYVSGLSSTDKGKEFIEVRKWCWETFGPSCELSLYQHSEKEKWAWRIDDQKSYSKQYYIYLTEEARTHFALKWI